MDFGDLLIGYAIGRLLAPRPKECAPASASLGELPVPPPRRAVAPPRSREHPEGRLDLSPIRDYLFELVAGFRGAEDVKRGHTPESYGSIDRPTMTRSVTTGLILAKVLLVASCLAGAAIYWTTSEEASVGAALVVGLLTGPFLYFFGVLPGLILSGFVAALGHAVRLSLHRFLERRRGAEYLRP